MTKPAPQAYWQLNPENNGLVLGQVQLFLWAKGICIAGHNQEGKLIAARAYHTEDVYDLEALENIILNEPLLADSIPVRKIWMAVSRSMIVPSVLMDRVIIDAWIRELYFIEHDEELATSAAPDLDVSIVYPKKKLLRQLMTRYFPQRTSRFLISPHSLLKSFPGDAPRSVVLMLLESTCSITFFESGRLVHHHIMELELVEDLIVYIGNYWNEIGDVREISGLVSGVSSRLSSVQSELLSYMPQFQMDFSTEHFLEELVKCA